MDCDQAGAVVADRNGWTRKYSWVLTWPDEAKNDWSAYHDDLYIGRILLDKTSLKAGQYIWAGGCSSWWGFKQPMPHCGHEAHAWQAAKRVEDWYDAGCAATGPRPAFVAQVIADLNERGKRFGW